MKVIGKSKEISSDGIFDEASDSLYTLECVANDIAKDYYHKTGERLDDVSLMNLAIAYIIRKGK